MSTSTVKASADVFTAMNKANETKSKTQETQDRFLKLLMTQLKNQDPMNPMDSAQSTSQMAQINMVTGIENMNASLSGMMATFNAAQSFQAAGLIGKQVLVAGDVLRLESGKSAQAEIEVPKEGGRITVAVFNDKNEKVDELTLGDLKAGRQAIEWDGKDAAENSLPPGKYYIAATSLQADGSNKQIPSFTFVGVESIAMNKGNVAVKLTDGRSVPFAEVTQIK